MGNFKSERVLLKAGVPQGSMLSPLLFNLFVNDISTKLTSCKIYQYADDTLLVSSHVNYHQAVRALQHDATRVMDWFYENFITVNASKTRLVCFRNPLKQVNLYESLVLHRSNCQDCTCAPLKYVETVKYLAYFFIQIYHGQRIYRMFLESFDPSAAYFITLRYLCHLP